MSLPPAEFLGYNPSSEPFADFLKGGSLTPIEYHTQEFLQTSDTPLLPGDLYGLPLETFEINNAYTLQFVKKPIVAWRSIDPHSGEVVECPITIAITHNYGPVKGQDIDEAAKFTNELIVKNAKEGIALNLIQAYYGPVHDIELNLGTIRSLPSFYRMFKNMAATGGLTEAIHPSKTDKFFAMIIHQATGAIINDSFGLFDATQHIVQSAPKLDPSCIQIKGNEIIRLK